MAREKIQFEPNTPVLVTLEYTKGKLDQSGRFGDEYYYSLADNGCMYIPLELEPLIQQYNPRRGSQLWIEKKWSGRRTDKPKWEVWPADEAGTGIPETQLEADLRRSLDQQRGAAAPPRPVAPPQAAPVTPRQPAQPSNGNGSTNGHNGHQAAPAPPRLPVTVLEDALKTVALALSNAEKYAKEIGYEAWPKQFTPEDVRTMANTLVIQRGDNR